MINGKQQVLSESGAAEKSRSIVEIVLWRLLFATVRQQSKLLIARFFLIIHWLHLSSV